MSIKCYIFVQHFFLFVYIIAAAQIIATGYENERILTILRLGTGQSTGLPRGIFIDNSKLL